MLAPRAKPGTRKEVLATAARMDLRAFGQLRASMSEVPGAKLLAKFDGPKFAIDDAAGGMGAFGAARLPGVQRKTIAGVSHWLMLDDPAALNAALDEVLK